MQITGIYSDGSFISKNRYTISDIVAQLYGITLTEKHVPTRSNIEPVGIILPPDAVPVSRAWEQRRQAAQRSNRKIQVGWAQLSCLIAV